MVFPSKNCEFQSDKSNRAVARINYGNTPNVLSAVPGLWLALDKCQLLLFLIITTLLFGQSKNCKQHFAFRTHVHFLGKNPYLLFSFFPKGELTTKLAGLSSLIDE